MWTDWNPLEPRLMLSPGVLAELLDGGQAFRWWRQPDGSWLGQWQQEIAQLRCTGKNVVEWRAPADMAARVAESLPDYLNLQGEHREALDRLPWRSDQHLARCLQQFPGLRLLRQPFGETLLAFLCSATKQIVQIKQMLALLARQFGERVPQLPDILESNGTAIGWQLPTWDRLARVSESDLRGCLLGFRARYIRATAEFLASAPGWLEETRQQAYSEAKARLCTLPGVGEKVADCVLLFGAGRNEAFPVDVWILKAMARRYGLDGWSPAQVAHFGRVHFATDAGLAQQFLFAFERAAKRAIDPAAGVTSPAGSARPRTPPARR